MSLFRREPPSDRPTSATEPRRPTPATSAPVVKATTLIAAGTFVVGEIRGDAEVVVDGKLEGHINLRSPVVVGKDGVVAGSIEAETVTVRGKVQGNVSASQRVQLDASAVLEGDISAPRVNIAEGAFFKGKVEMGEVKSKRSKPEAKAASGGPEGEQKA